MIKSQLQEIYTQVLRDMERTERHEPWLSKQAHVLVPAGYEEAGITCTRLLALTPTASYFRVSQGGVLKTLIVPRASAGGQAAFRTAEAFYMLLGMVSLRLAPAVETVQFQRQSCKLLPRLDGSLRAFVGLHALPLQQINVYAQQLLRYLQIGEQFSYKMGVFDAGRLFLDTARPEVLFIPEILPVKLLPDTYVTQAGRRLTPDCLELGLLLAEMATGMPWDAERLSEADEPPGAPVQYLKQLQE